MKTLDTVIASAEETFSKNVEAVHKLMGFDDALTQFLAQACRHAIVHNGSKADVKLLKQIADAKPRDLKQTLSSGQKIQFEPSEVKLIGESMKHYMRALGVGLRKQWNNA